MNKVKNVLLVHGAWGNGSNWTKLIPILVAQGCEVSAVHLPLTSLEDDVATVRRALARLDAATLLVGHSYGGVVITEAGKDAGVSGLVYVAAFAPDAGESAGSLLASMPPMPLASEATADAEGFVRMTLKGVTDDFAQDLPDEDRRTLFAVQTPTSVRSVGAPVTQPAWKSKPSRYIVATQDRAISPSLQLKMAERINAKTTSIVSSHMVMLSHPTEVADVILDATH